MLFKISILLFKTVQNIKNIRIKYIRSYYYEKPSTFKLVQQLLLSVGYVKETDLQFNG